MKKIIIGALAVLFSVSGLRALGATPLHSAALFGKTEMAKLLISNGAKVNARDNFGYTPLHKAAEYNKIEMARLLIANGANVNAKGKFLYQTPLHGAAGHTEIVRLLISKGAKVNARDKYGQTPLHNAALFGYTKTARLLIEKGANVNAKGKDGKTPLDKASDIEIVKLLISKGAKNSR